MSRPAAHGPMGGPGHRGGPPGMMAGEKAKDFKGSMGKLARYLGRFFPAIIAGLLFAAASTVFNIIGPKILAEATNTLFAGVMASLTGTGGIDFASIAQTLLFLLGVYLLSALLSGIQGFIMTGVSTKISYSMRRDLSQKINRLPLSYYDRVQSGDVLSRITNDVDTVTQTLNQSLSQIVTSITSMVGILIMMFSISPVMTLVALCILPLSMVVVGLVVRKSQPFFRKQQEFLGAANGHVEEMYGAHTIVKAFNQESKSIEDYEAINQALYHSAWKS